ncbi:LADA_0F13256g1_1 [Lachancea dasiensis]|uniref:LADA_0F13256g1_1 n=1 Tax=Lachancea dasiensis TaxID=1072105 RepID=A0A1G4JMR7_9SACH|nr:LADA_0F13256g1_1 [Lachancea dasiensis]
MSIIQAPETPLLELANGHSGAVLACKILNGGSTVVSSGLDAHLCIWDLDRSANYVVEIDRNQSAVTALDVVDGPFVAAGSASSQIFLIDIETGQSLRRYSGHKRAINQVRALSKNQFISVSDDGSAKLWDSKQKRPVWEVSTDFPFFTAAVPSQADHVVYVSGLEPVVRAYDLRQNSGQELFSWQGHRSESITSIDISSNRMMCSLAFDNEIHIDDAKMRPMRDSRTLGVIDANVGDNPNKFLLRNKFIKQDKLVMARGCLFDVTSQELLIDYTASIPTEVSVIDMDFDEQSQRAIMASENGSLYLYKM